MKEETETCDCMKCKLRRGEQLSEIEIAATCHALDMAREGVQSDDQRAILALLVREYGPFTLHIPKALNATVGVEFKLLDVDDKGARVRVSTTDISIGGHSVN